MTIDYKNAARWMAREHKWLNEFLARYEQEGTVDASRQKLADYAAGKANVGVGTVALSLLSGFHGALGCSKVLSGDDSGFLDIDIACLEEFWVMRLLTRGYDLDERSSKRARVLMDGVATCWMHAEAIGATSIRSWLDTLIKKIASGHGSVGGKDMNPLCTLVAHLVTGTDVADLESSGWARIGVYAPVCAGALSSSDFDELAAFHQKGVDGAGYPPFHAYPYRMIPFELLAIAKRTGLRIEGRHPLLTSPLAAVRSVPEIALTDELRELAESDAAEVTTAE